MEGPAPRARPGRLVLVLVLPLLPLLLVGGCGAPAAESSPSTDLADAFDQWVESGHEQEVASGAEPASPVPLLLFAVTFVALWIVGRDPRRCCSPDRWPGVTPLATVALLLAVAVWPMMTPPFQLDVTLLRVFFALDDAFGDPGHPPLLFLLTRPVTWFSAQPWAIRLVPLLFLGVETALLVIVSTRAGGRLAGLLAGIWFACEVRRRHGLVDFSDWDLAGTFLLGMVCWLQRVGPLHGPAAEPGSRYAPTRREWLVLGLLLAAGVFSSWLVLVPAGVLVAVLALDSRRGRLERGAVLRLAALLALLGTIAALFVLKRTGAPRHGPENLAMLFQEMAIYSPLGRNLWMAVPLAAGLVFLALRRRTLVARFLLGTFMAVPAVMALMLPVMNVSGYYLDLITPLVLFAAATGITRALFCWDSAPSSRGGIVRTARLLALLLLAALTITWPGSALHNDGRLEDIYPLAERLHSDPRPTLTNWEILDLFLAWDRIRLGLEEADIERLRALLDAVRNEQGDGIPGGPSKRRTRVPADDSCERICRAGSASGFFLFRIQPPRNKVDFTRCRACLDPICRRIDPAGGEPPPPGLHPFEPRTVFQLYECRP